MQWNLNNGHTIGINESVLNIDARKYRDKLKFCTELRPNTYILCGGPDYGGSTIIMLHAVQGFPVSRKSNIVYTCVHGLNSRN